MNKQPLRTRLQQLTGGLKPVAGAANEQLRGLQKSLALQLTINPEFTVFGQRLHHEGAQHLEAATDMADEFSHLDELFDQPAIESGPTIPPLVFRRETEFRSNLLGNSVPAWGSGMAVTESFGPFIDAHGLHVWYDFYRAKRLIRVFLKGNS